MQLPSRLGQRPNRAHLLVRLRASPPARGDAASTYLNACPDARRLALLCILRLCHELHDNWLGEKEETVEKLCVLTDQLEDSEVVGGQRNELLTTYLRYLCTNILAQGPLGKGGKGRMRRVAGISDRAQLVRVLGSLRLPNHDRNLLPRVSRFIPLPIPSRLMFGKS
jgi:hypothetical protein